VSFTNSIKQVKFNQAIFIPRIACAKSSRHQTSKYRKDAKITQTKINHKGEINQRNSRHGNGK